MGLNKYEGYLERWWLGSRMILDLEWFRIDVI
jgi:hypothetical protein